MDAQIKLKIEKIRSVQNITNYVILFILIPAVYSYEVFIVLPLVVEKGSKQYNLHMFCGAYLLINIIGNIIYGKYTNTSIGSKPFSRRIDQNWTKCDLCDCLRPPRAWHCTDCNKCILNRDHHCTFWACCIGYCNRRYFAIFTLHTFVSMVYTSYLNIRVLLPLLELQWNFGLIGRLLCPLMIYCIKRDVQTIYVLIIILNAIIAILTGSLFVYHFYNIINGKIVSDSNINNKKNWKINITEVFGYRWYLAWILPLIPSPLPEYYDVKDLKST